MLLLRRGKHMENLIAQLEPVHHTLGRDCCDLLGHMLRFGRVERSAGDNLVYLRPVATRAVRLPSSMDSNWPLIMRSLLLPCG